jgi:hypothetical protein
MQEFQSFAFPCIARILVDSVFTITYLAVGHSSATLFSVHKYFSFLFMFTPRFDLGYCVLFFKFFVLRDKLHVLT